MPVRPGAPRFVMNIRAESLLSPKLPPFLPPHSPSLLLMLPPALVFCRRRRGTMPHSRGPWCALSLPFPTTRRLEELLFLSLSYGSATP